MATSISHRIALEGGRDLEQSIQQAVNSGVQALQTLANAVRQTNFDKLQDDTRAAAGEFDKAKGSVDQLSGSLRQAGQAGQEAGRKASEGGQAIGAAFASSATKVVLAVVAITAAATAMGASFTKAFADAGKENVENAQSLGLSTRAYLAVKKAADEAGVSIDDVQAAFNSSGKAAVAAVASTQRLEQSASAITAVGKSLSVIQDLGNGANVVLQKIGNATIQIFNGASASAEKARASSKNAGDAIQQLGVDVNKLRGLSEQAQRVEIARALDRIPDSALKASLGTRVFGDDWRDVMNILLKTNPAVKTSSDALAQLAAAVSGSSDQIKSSFSALDGAVDKSDSDNREKLGALKTALDNLLSGKGSVDAVKAALADLREEIDGDAAATAKLDSLAATISGLSDGTTAIKALQAAADQGTAALIKTAQSYAELGKQTRELTPEQSLLGKKLSDAWADLGKAISAVRQQIGAVLAPGALANAQWLTQLVDGSRALVLEWTKARSLDLRKFFDDQGGAGTVLANVLTTLKGFAEDLGRVFTSVLVPAAQLVMQGFDTLASAINNLFGTNISGRFLLIVTAIGLLSGAFGLLGSIIAPVAGLFGPILAALGSLLLLAPRTGTAVRAAWGEVAVGGRAASAAAATESQGILAAWRSLVAGDLSGAWKIFTTAALQAFDVIKSALVNVLSKAGFGDTISAIAKTFTVLTLAATGFAKIINTIFGTNIGPAGVLLIGILLQMSGVLRTISLLAPILAFAFSSVGLAIGVVAAAVVILLRQFPDLQKTWENITKAFDNLLNGKFADAFQNLKDAFGGFLDNLKKEGVGAWVVFGAAALVAFSLIQGAIVTTGTAVTGLLGTLAPLLRFAAALTAIYLVFQSGKAQVEGSSEALDAYQKKQLELSDAFLQGKITADQYQAGLDKLDKEAAGAGQATDKAKTSTLSWADAIQQVKDALSGLAGAATPAQRVKDAFDAISDSAKKAAENIKIINGGNAGAVVKPGDSGNVVKPPSLFDNPDIPLSPNIEDRRGESQTGDMLQQLQQLREAIDQTLQELAASAQEVWRGILAAGSSAFQQLAALIDSAMQQAAQAVDSAAQQMIGSLQNVVDAARQAADALSSVGNSGSGGAGPGFDRGGYTGSGGRLEPAGIVHRGEYVEPQHVVRQPGVLGFLETLRRTGDLAATIARFSRGFSIGGLADRIGESFSVHALPGFAGGGLVPAPTGAGLHPVTLQLANGRAVGGFFATPRGLDDLEREAVLSEAVSAGTPPRWA